MFTKILKPLLVGIIVLIFVWGITHVSSVRGDVILTGFTMSEDGKTINLEIEVISNQGYVRKITTETVDDKLYIDFHSTTGVNNETGSKTVFPIRVSDVWNEIYFYEWGTNKTDTYKLVMKKSDDQWYQYLNFTSSSQN